MIKKCVICGAEFEPRPYNRSVCYADHHHPCPVCGKDVMTNDPKRQNCACSRKCGQQMGNIARKITFQERYGVDNPSHIDEVREKISSKLKEQRSKADPIYKICEVCGKEFQLQWPYNQHTCSSKCRGIYRKQNGISKAVYEKASATNAERYGVNNPGQVEEFREKRDDAIEAKYGVRHALQNPDLLKKMSNTVKEHFGVDWVFLTEEANRDNRERISKINTKFQSALKSAGIVADLEKYLGTKFFDLVIEDQKIVIEIDPTYTHNCIGNHWNSHGLDPRYHIDKTNLARSNGYRCIHIWDWDDKDKIIQSLDVSTTYYARKLDCKQVSKKEAVEFTKKYHIQGSCNGQNVCFGLFDGDDMIQIMTFGNPRYAKSYQYELLRLCTRFGCKVIGGPSKLFKHFIQEYHPESVISYCDLSKFSGYVYENMGMTLNHYSPPSKIWSKNRQHVTDNLLRQRGYDQLFNTSYGKGTSNEQLMLDHHWLPVYDCGQAVYSYRR